MKGFPDERLGVNGLAVSRDMHDHGQDIDVITEKNRCDPIMRVCAVLEKPDLTGLHVQVRSGP